MQVKHLQGELERVTLKLRQADKSAAANQQIMVGTAPSHLILMFGNLVPDIVSAAA